MKKKEQRKCTNCVNLWWFVHKEGDATPSVYCEVDGVVIDTKHVDAEKCRHYIPPVGQRGESTEENVEWFDRNFKRQLKNDRDSKVVSQRLNTKLDGSVGILHQSTIDSANPTRMSSAGRRGRWSYESKIDKAGSLLMVAMNGIDALGGVCWGCIRNNACREGIRRCRFSPRYRYVCITYKAQQ